MEGEERACCLWNSTVVAEDVYLSSGAIGKNSEFPSALWLEAHSTAGLGWERGGVHLVPLSKGSSVTAPSSDVVSLLVWFPRLVILPH